MNTFLHALHCDLEHHINVTGAEMMRVFRELAQMDFSAYDYLVRRRGADGNQRDVRAARVSAAGGRELPEGSPRHLVCAGLLALPNRVAATPSDGVHPHARSRLEHGSATTPSSHWCGGILFSRIRTIRASSVNARAER